MADEVVQGLSAEEPRRPATWDRSTVADGSWMQRYTLDRFSARDVYLASAIDNEIDNRVSADIELQDQIDTLEMSTDVIDVWGNYTTFTSDSANRYFPEGKPAEITFNDIIKVLNDEETPIIPDDPETTGHQTYWQLVRKEGSTAKKPTTANSEWHYIGYVDPYYSTREVDNIIDELSSTIQGEYIPWSAQEGLVGENNTFASNDVTAAWAFGKGNTANYTSLTVGQTNSASYGGSIGQDNKSNFGIAAGTNNTANSYSLAVGSTNSSYQDSLTIGISNSANLYAGAIGNHISAGNQAFAVGENTTAYQNSLAIGSNVSANTDTFSIGIQTSGSNYSIAVGSNVKAKDKSLAIGTNISSNSASIANGVDTSANVNAGAIGNSASAFTNSFSVGEKTYANATALAIGKQASADTRSIAVGENTKSDLDSIAVGWLASSYSSSIANGQQASAKDNSLAVGTSAQALDNSLAVGFGYPRIYEGEEFGQIAKNNSLNVGLNWSADDRTCLIGEGNSATTTDGGTARLSFAQGSYNRVAEMSMAQGTSNKADYRSFAQGNTNSAYSNSIAQGAENTANANSIAQGSNNSANSDSIAQGNGCTANDNSQAFGKGNIINNSGTVFGAYNKTSSNIAFVIGNGTGPEAANRSDLFLIDKNGGVSSNSFSGVNATIKNVTGDTAKFSGFSGTNISASDGSTTAKIENLINSAKNGGKAFDVVNSAKFSANNTAVGYLSAGFSLSSKSTDFLSITKENNNIIGISSNPGITGIRFDGNTSPITITDSIANLYFTNFDFVQGQGGVVTASFDDYDYVKRTQQNLIIGDVSSLNVSNNSTALGSYASANQCSFSLNVSPINTFSSYATNNSIALGETNYASYNSYAIGTKNIASGRAADPGAGITEVNQVYTIGYNNVNKGSNSYIIGSNNTNVTPGIVILGDRARNVHIPGDLLAVGNGNGNDALLLNFAGCHFNFSNHILLDDKGLLNYAFEKIYSWSEVMGLGLPVASTAGTPTSTTCSSTDDLLASTILIYGGQPKDVYAFYVKKAYSTELTNYTHSFRIYTTYLSNYQLRFGIPDSYNVLLKNFSDNGWGFPPGGSKSDTNVVELLNFGTNESYRPSTPATYNNIVNSLGFFDCDGHFVEATNNGNYNYFWIHSIYGGQYLDVTIDSVSHVFIMRKGGG